MYLYRVKQIKLSEMNDQTWIPVTDSLPPVSERDEWRAMTNQSDKVVAIELDTTKLAVYHHDDMKWIDDLGRKMYPHHWLPIPPLPKQ